MRDLGILFLHLLTTVVKLMRRGGARAVVAESLLVKHQLVVLNRGRERAPNLRPMDRVFAGLCSLLVRPARFASVAVVFKPSTLLSFHRALVQRKYRFLFSAKSRAKPGPKGPSAELVAAIVQMKEKNPRFGCPRIAQQLSFVFGLEINKDVVRRVLAKHYRPNPRDGGPSWLTFLGHTKDSLWSVDMFRCESLILRSHWVMVIMDQCSRRIIGFAVHGGALDGPAVCRMFYRIVARHEPPRNLSSDNDPLFRYHRWKANLRILDIAEIKTVPHVPISHPFIERLVGTVRREFTDHTPFWNAQNLEMKLTGFADYYNAARVHHSLGGVTPETKAGDGDCKVANLNSYRWQSHCRGLYQLPLAA
ncbi:MAG: integrase core domain-containing protein [Gammaproteobacteria bacterium]